MTADQLTLPLSDLDLMRLAQHRFNQAERENATPEDVTHLLDIFPTVLQRFQEKTRAAGDFIEIPRLRDPELDGICY